MLDAVIEPLAASLTELSERRPIERRFRSVVGQALDELVQVQANPSARQARDLTVWPLAVPGALRALGTNPPPPRSMLSLRYLVPVSALLPACLLLVSRLGGPAGQPPFVAAWLARPWYLGPWGLVLGGLAALLAATAHRTWLTWQFSTRDNDLLDLEADLAAPFAALRVAVHATEPDRGVLAAQELSRAASELGKAAGQLSGAVVVATELRAAADRLLDVLPEVTRHAAELGRHTPPLVDLVAATLEAATQVRTAVDAVVTQVAHSALLAERAVDYTAAVQAGERPFTTAAEQISGSATVLAETTRAMEAAIEKANWLALVADGLRHDEMHGPDSDPRL